MVFVEGFTVGRNRDFHDYRASIQESDVASHGDNSSIDRRFKTDT